MIDYFILTFQGFEFFKENYKNENFNNTIIRIVDNGNQKIDNFQKYISSKNLGCAGGWNLICYIAFDYLNLNKIVIGQDDTIVEEKELIELIELCDENTIVGLMKPHFEFSTFAIHKQTYKKIGKFDENCIDAYCEDADYKQRCYLNNIKIKSLEKNLNKNKGLSRIKNPRIYDTIAVNRAYIKSKWGKSINNDEMSQKDEQPPYEFKSPFNKKELSTSFLPITDRMKKIHNIFDEKFLSENEITKFMLDNQQIEK